eukprot:snap_masked-scaffold_5-processed-gene-10.3-mRNA-1 protein AED:1.00 eAED:1.00 QI:0/-1/0/0/-1/1/1/0/60
MEFNKKLEFAEYEGTTAWIGGLETNKSGQKLYLEGIAFPSKTIKRIDENIKVDSFLEVVT